MAKKFSTMDFLRTTSVGCVQEPKGLVLDCLERDDLHTFTDLINTSDVEAGARSAQHWINQPVEGELGDTVGNLLQVAVTQKKYQFADGLVKVGAQRDIVSEATGLSAVHWAAQAGDLDALKIVVGTDDEVNVNHRSSDRHGGVPALYFAAEGQNKGHSECVSFLLGLDETDVDMRDNSGTKTALFAAVMANNEESIRRLIEYGASVDAKCGKKTIREYLKDKLPSFNPASVQVRKPREVMSNLKDKMFSVLKGTKLNTPTYSADLANFKTYSRFIRNVNEQDTLDEVFDLACEKGLHDHVRILLKKGVNPNTKSRPLLEVTFKGFHRVLQELINDPRTNLTVVNPQTKETILHTVLKMEYEMSSQEDYQKCLDILLMEGSESVDQMRAIINKQDTLQFTALHYATQKWQQKTVRALLELGANIGIKNHWKEIPISKIKPETMEEFLDEFCLTSNKDVVHEDFNLTFKYSFLAPDIEALPEKYRGGDPEQDGVQYKTPRPHALPETECLWHMGQSLEHRHLLKHPVITSFLWFKWKRIRRYFNRNLRFFLLFVFMLTWFIFEKFGSYTYSKFTNTMCLGLFIVFFVVMLTFIIRDWLLDIDEYRRSTRLKDAEAEKSCVFCFRLIISNWIEVLFVLFMVGVLIIGSSTLKLGLTILLALFLAREILQMSMSLKRYVFSPENWIEVSMIVLVTVILYNENGSFELNRHLAAICILLSWGLMITIIGKHPKLGKYNVYVTMFFKVLKSFFFFLTWYSMFIIAYGLGFYIILHDDIKRDSPREAGDDEYVFFNRTWLSIIKTSTMFVGELEFGDLPFNMESPLAPLSYLFFLTFVFFIVVVLMNLLNGLAVSDTGIIQEKAEIFSYLSIVETISYYEAVMLGDPFDFLSNVPAFVSSLPPLSMCRQLYRNSTMRTLFRKVGATDILVFYKFLPHKTVTLKPNKKEDDCCCLRLEEMDPDIVASAKNIVARKQKDFLLKEESATLLNSQMLNRLNELEKKLDKFAQIEDKVNQIFQKLIK